MDRIKMGKRIRQLRERSGITQQKLGDLLGISRSAVVQLEHAERKVSGDELVKLSEVFNMSIENLLDFQKDAEVILEETGTQRHDRHQIRVNVPQGKMEKFKETLLYILNEVGSKANIGETVIYKLLYFIDFNFYEKYEEQLIGATYIKNVHGPTPVEFKKIVDKMINDEEITKVDSRYFDYPQTKYLPLRKADMSGFKASEIEVICDVLNKLSDMNAAQISHYSHNDVPWLSSEEGKPIEYESAFYRTLPYSVRDYGEDV